jgi:hypothetical protein
MTLGYLAASGASSYTGSLPFKSQAVYKLLNYKSFQR